MKNLIRTGRGAVVAVVLAVVMAAPVAAAAPAGASTPIRTVFSLSPFVDPAGTACAFDVGAEPSGGFIAETAFADGSILVSIRARGAYVNLETGARYQTLDNTSDYRRFDPQTGVITGVDAGPNTWSFLPGDDGPFGVVGSHGALYHFVGTLSYTYDTKTNHATILGYTGTVEDVCAALS